MKLRERGCLIIFVIGVFLLTILTPAFCDEEEIKIDSRTTIVQTSHLYGGSGGAACGVGGGSTGGEGADVRVAQY